MSAHNIPFSLLCETSSCSVRAVYRYIICCLERHACHLIFLSHCLALLARVCCMLFTVPAPLALKVPCPYLQLRLCPAGDACRDTHRDTCIDKDRTGEETEEEEAGSVLDTAALESLLLHTSPSLSPVTTPGELVQEEHPILGAPSSVPSFLSAPPLLPPLSYSSPALSVHHFLSMPVYTSTCMSVCMSVCTSLHCCVGHHQYHLVCTNNSDAIPIYICHPYCCHVYAYVYVHVYVCVGVPAACLHICGLPERLALLQEQSRHQQQQQQCPDRDGDRSRAMGGGRRGAGVERSLYLLQWFSLVQPRLGLPPLPPALFQQASARLLLTWGDKGRRG